MLSFYAFGERNILLQKIDELLKLYYATVGFQYMWILVTQITMKWR